MPRLSELEVLAIDCQATAAAPRGRLLEIGWSRVGTTEAPPRARLVALPGGERIPPAVARITGISDRMLRDGVEPGAAWRELLAEAAALAQQPAPTVIHFARFEEPFLRALAGGDPPLALVCTNDIARRVLPELPRRTLRALTGYFGRGVGRLRRSADHVAATAFVWRELVRLLDAEGVSTWDALGDWLGAPVPSTGGRRRVWPMARDVRLSLPDAPGVYRLLRSNGDVLYVGKAASIRDRVNSHFRHQHGLAERTLEMLSQARDVSFDLAPTALEAALREPDEIKRHRPPYNVALTDEDRHLWFAPPDLAERRRRPSGRCTLGPFPSPEILDDFASLGGTTGAPLADLLRLGTRLWREGRRDGEDDGDPELIALRAALARRRAVWLSRLVDAAVVWREPGAAAARLVVIERGDFTVRDHAADAPPPVPPGHRRPAIERLEAFTVARFDRLRVLTTELKRLVAAGAPAAVRFGEAAAIDGARLANALAWV